MGLLGAQNEANWEIKSTLCRQIVVYTIIVVVYPVK